MLFYDKLPKLTKLSHYDDMWVIDYQIIKFDLKNDPKFGDPEINKMAAGCQKFVLWGPVRERWLQNV